MRKFGKESTAPAEGVSRESGAGWLQNHGALAVCIIALLAFVLRTAFAYGVSASGDFALSGGSDAQYHLHVVESILNGTIIFGADGAINYPVGGLNTNPPLYDFIAAGIGSFAGASTALAILAPIFGALTVFPVYMIGKELKGVTTGVLAALIYALMALPIMSSVLSNGTELAFTAFLFAIFTLMLIKLVRKVNENTMAMKEAIIAGIFLGLIALSWNGFRSILVLLIIIMVIQIVLDRFNSKDFSVTLYSYSIVMVVGVALSALYYIPAGLWDAVFSGPVLITVTAVAFGFIFKAVQTKPWIFTIPALIIAYAVVAVVLFFVNSDLCTALLFGNSAFINPIMEQLANLGVSISTMSAYYGWVLMWIPFGLGLYEFYKYARKDRSHQQLFLTMFLLIPWMFAWTSFGAAVVAGVVFAIASAYAIMGILARVDLKAYWTSMRLAGFPGCFKKMIKPVPFITVLIGAFLIILPGCVYAIDAGISSNETYGYFAYGNTTYTIQTGDSYPYTNIYDDLSATGNTDLAVLTWINTSTDVAALGFNTVNDRLGSGASAAAHMYLAEGAAGATAIQLVRVMMAHPDTDFSGAFPGHKDVYQSICTYIANPESARTLILADTTVYGNINSDITDENAVYFVCEKIITDGMSTVDIMDAYNFVSNEVREHIGYYIVDGSMVPLAYGDGDSLATMAHFAGYSNDSYGAATQFYSLITYYSNYYPAVGTDALYDTFMWKALIGPSPAEMGYSSSFSYLYDLASSKGDVKTMPGYGLAGYSIQSWYVKYNTNSSATTSDDGWEYMAYDEATALQSKDGGVINYLSSIILYEYVGVGKAVYTSSVENDFNEPLAGLTVQVITFDEKYESTTVYSETKTDADGKFTIQVPAEDYTISIKNGNLKLQYTEGMGAYVVQSSKFSGTVTVGDNVDFGKYEYVIENGDIKAFIPSVFGVINSTLAEDEFGEPVHITPGTYTYKLIDDTGATVSSGSITLYPGSNPGLMVSPKTSTITATVTDYFGAEVTFGKVIATNTETYISYEADIEDGVGKVVVPTGTYTVTVGGGWTSTYSTFLNLSSDRSINITAYNSVHVDVTGTDVPLTAYAGDFSAEVIGGEVWLPLSIGATSYAYTFYGVDGNKVYYGVYEDGSSVSISSGKANKVSGDIGSKGVVNFYYDKMVFSVVTDDEGKFTIMLPGLLFNVYATNSANAVYLGTAHITGDNDLGTLDLVGGRKVTGTYQYESGTSKSNIGLPFTPVEMTFKVGTNSYALPGVTDSTGQVTFIVPTDAETLALIANGGEINNESFQANSLKYTAEKGTSAVSATITIAKANVVKHTIYTDYEITLIPYGEEKETTIIGPTEVAVGAYTAKINAKTGHYFDGTVYVYPGQEVFSGLEAIAVYGVKIEKFELDDLEITGEKSHDNYNGDDTYYFEYDCEYYLVTKNGSTGYMKNGYLYTASGETPIKTLDMKSEALVNEIKGFVGAIADGKVEVLYGDAKVVATVTSGAFTVEIPADVTSATFVAKVTKTIGSQKFGFSGVYKSNNLSSKIVNIPVESDPSAVDYSGKLDARIDYASFNDGVGLVTLTIYNNSDADRAVVVTAGSAWILDEDVHVTIAPNESVEVQVKGTYEPNGTGIGSVGMSLIVSDFNGSDSVTLNIVDGESYFSASSISMKTAATCDNKDKLSGAEYMYALTFVNEGQAGNVKINVTVDPSYSVMLMTENGEYIKASGGIFSVPARSSTIVYAKVMMPEKDMEQAPSINVDADVTGGSVTISPSTISVEVESMTVSGDTAVNEKSGIPLGVWFILALSALMLILIVWMGSKRGGVFSRR